MKQKTNKTLLLLPCAVIAAMIGITTYFACSADDDWEGSPEYLHTHAPMLTRAGVDVSGGGGSGVDEYGYTLWIHECNNSGVSSTETVDGITGFTAKVTFKWDDGLFSTLFVHQDIYDENHNLTIEMPTDIDTIRYELLGTPTFANSASTTPTGDHLYWTATITTQLNLRYTKYTYNSNGETISTFTSNNIPIVFSVDVKNYTYWTYIED